MFHGMTVPAAIANQLDSSSSASNKHKGFPLGTVVYVVSITHAIYRFCWFAYAREERWTSAQALNEKGDLHAAVQEWSAAAASWSTAVDILLGPYKVGHRSNMVLLECPHHHGPSGSYQMETRVDARAWQRYAVMFVDYWVNGRSQDRIVVDSLHFALVYSLCATHLPHP